MGRLSGFILRRPRILLAAALGLTVAFGFAARSSTVDNSVEALLPQSDPDLAFYRELKQRFGSDELVMIGLEVRDLFGRDSLAAIQRISDALHEVTLAEPSVEDPVHLIDRVVSLTEVDQIRGAVDDRGDSTFSVSPFLRLLPSDERESAQLRSSAERDPLFVGNFLAHRDGSDGNGTKTTLILGRIVDRPGDVGYRHLVQEQVETILANEARQSPSIVAYHVAGQPALKASLASTSQRELRRLVPVVFIVVGVLLFLLFRTRQGTLLPMMVILLGSTWTLGFLTLCGSKISVISVITLPLVMVIGGATSVYLFSELYEATQASDDYETCVRRTFDRVLWPSFLASLTTAAGFLSLTPSPIQLIRELGAYTAFGVMATWLIAATTLPGMLLWIGAGSPPSGALFRSPRLVRLQDTLVELIERHHWAVLWGGAAAAALAIVGIARIHTTTDLVGFLKPSHSLRRAYGFLEREIGGVRPLSVSIRTGPGDLLDPTMMSRIARFQDWMEEQPGVDHAFSVVDYLRRMNQAMHDGDPVAFRLPETRQQIAAYLLLYEDPVESRLSPFLYPSWETASDARIHLRTRNLDTVETAALVESFQSYVDRHGLSTIDIDIAAGLPPRRSGIAALDSLWERLRRSLAGRQGASPMPEQLENGQMGVRMTGSSLLYANMANSVVEGQVTSLGLALVFVWIVISVLMRSLRTGLLAMIPNAFPILLMLGMMGCAGIPLDFVNAVISAIAIGIAVDDTVHFLVRYRRLRHELGSERPAVRATLHEVGRPMIFTSVVLSLGFLAIGFSDFGPHFYFATLSSFAILAAVIGDLILLPACIFAFRPRV